MSDLAKVEESHSPIIVKETNNKSTDMLKKEQSSNVEKESIVKKTTEDLQRAIEGLKEIPDEEFQEFLGDDFMEGLNVVDAWEGEDKNHEEKRSQAKGNEQKQISSREKPKREEKKREETRRDPSKSTKDIERDKMRTKRDNESKLLAEKEKAIKHLLDSDNVVPPGTESEAIQSITDKQNEERVQMRTRKSKERRRSQERVKLIPVRRKSYDRFRTSPHRRILSPIRRRSPFRVSPERRNSPRVNCDHRSPLILSPERRRSPYRSWERRLSADRRWSAERHKRRMELQERRYSPRRRSRSRSRSLERRTKKRSPFINEISRRLQKEAIMSNSTYIPAATPIEGISPIINASIYSQETEVRGPLSQSYIHQGGPPTPAQQLQPPPPPSVLPMSSGMQSFMNFDIPSSQPSMGFDGAPLHSIPTAHYSSGPVMYNHNAVQTNTMPTQSGTRTTLLPTPHQTTPQPVPAPGPMDHSVMGGYTPQHGIASHLEAPNKPVNASVVLSPSSNYKDHRSLLSSHNGFQPREERLKTPEPPVISDIKKGKNKIHWEEEDVQQYDTLLTTQTMQMHQKICQTEEIETNTKSVEARVEMVDFEMQVYPYDIEHGIREERKSIMDRLDWKTRDKPREADDLRWSLSNSSQKRPWKRTLSPPNRRSQDQDYHFETVSSPEHLSKNFRTNSPIRNRDSYSGGSNRDQFVSRRYSPNYKRSMNMDDFRENRSDRSRGESPMNLDEDSDVESDETFTFQREVVGWHGRGGRSFRGKSNSTKGKYLGNRQHRGRCPLQKF
ncbi:hypothetical protein M0802_007012 [Mischocyttarus mexicanus]|nr:hypothetical protein M0802_007012 [Mischocyttarus mexicanus]